MSYLNYLSDELRFIQRELQKPHSDEDLKWLDRQEDRRMVQLASEMTEEGLMDQQNNEIAKPSLAPAKA